MNKIIKMLFSLSLLVVISSCTQSEPESSIEKVNISSAKELISDKESVVVLDVRTPEEFETGHIEGALNIDINNESFADKVSKLDKNKTYVVHCGANAQNGRTDKSLKVMDGLGFNKLRDLSGGIAAWKEQGNPVVK